MQGEELAPDRQAPAGMHITELRDRKPRPVVPRARQIRQLAFYGRIYAPARPRGKARATTPFVWAWRPLSMAEVAFLFGVSRQAVQKIAMRERERRIYRR